MGIPLLHPWANRLAEHGYEIDGRRVILPPGPPLVHCEEHGLPIHGLLNASPHWHVTSREPARLAAELDFGAHPELLAAFPFPHRLRLEASLSEHALTVSLSLLPTGDVAVPVAFGFHPYLNLPADATVELPARRRLLLDDHGLPTGETEECEPYAGPVRDWDDAFDGVDPTARFVVSGEDRAVELSFVEGYSCTQVFSPPDAPFVCFEPMTAPADALRRPKSLELASTERSATFRISVS
jgi:galactose mutarotase-like enzyme